MSPAGLATVACEVSFAERRAVVELGSGVSTVVLARLARELGGRVWAVEHHPGWAGWVRRQLDRDGLGGVATVIEAPLTRTRCRWRAHRSTTRPPCPSCRSPASSCCWSTGRPATAKAWRARRFPALPALGARLAPGALVVLDDADRPAEAEILDAWERDEGFVLRPAARRADRRRAPGRLGVAAELELVLEPALGLGADRVVDRLRALTLSCAVTHIRHGAPCSRARSAHEAISARPAPPPRGRGGRRGPRGSPPGRRAGSTTSSRPRRSRPGRPASSRATSSIPSRSGGRDQRPRHLLQALVRRRDLVEVAVPAHQRQQRVHVLGPWRSRPPCREWNQRAG